MNARALAYRLAKLDKAVRNKIIRRGLRDASNVILKPARKRAPKRTGLTKKAIKIKTAKRKKGRIALNVMIGKGSYKGETFYASFVEFGTRKMKARPFLTPTYLAYRRQAMRVGQKTMLRMFYAEIGK